jgi:hypothetical protein
MQPVSGKWKIISSHNSTFNIDNWTKILYIVDGCLLRNPEGFPPCILDIVLFAIQSTQPESPGEAPTGPARIHPACPVPGEEERNLAAHLPGEITQEPLIINLDISGENVRSHSQSW